MTVIGGRGEGRLEYQRKAWVHSVQSRGEGKRVC